MSSDAAISFLCAVLAAGGNALANVMQRKASLLHQVQEPADDHSFGVGVLRGLVRQRIWLLGIGGMVLSFLLQAVALDLGQLSSVETVITLEVPLTLLIASQVFKSSIGRAEWTGIWTLTAGMIVLIGSLNPQPGNETDVSDGLYAVAGGATVGFIIVLIVAGQRGGRIWRTAFLGAAAGTCFGQTATFIKETVTQLSDRGLIGVVTTWQSYAAVGLGVSGVVLMQWSLHTGPLLAAQPGFTLMDPLVSILWGVLIYNEVTRTGVWILPAIAGAGAIAVGVTMLARSPLLATLNEHDVGTDDLELLDPDNDRYGAAPRPAP